MGDFSFSDVFTEESSVFLLYKHKQKKVVPLSLDLDWALIERVALAHKRFHLLEVWIDKEKKETYIQIFEN